MQRALLAAAVAALMAAGVSRAQTPPTSEPHDHATAAAAAPAHACCSAHQDAMQPHDAALRDLVAKMNQATGDAKVALMADVINALTTQRHSCPMMGHGH
jgi:hypothetical protein